ncbi:MAG: GTPase Era [Rhodobacteraceae bacterium]|nr:GTPase Era [Paracoccaceae bacterium]
MTETRCGFVALIGEPNAGKSTLMNRIVGSRISIVTHKVQTTRTRLRGIALHGASQIVLVDTPGLFRVRRNLDRAMVATAWAGAADADITVLLVEAHRGITMGTETILDGLRNGAGGKRVVLAINKIDKVKSNTLLGITQDLTRAFAFGHVFMICAERGHGVGDLTNWLAAAVPAGPWLYHEDQIADVPMRLLAADLTREKLMLRLHQELPYYLTVETENWQARKDGSVRVDQVIYVIRDGHKGIVLGQKGKTIKAVSQAARAALEELIGGKAHLFLQVKTRPEWENEPERYKAMGLDFRDTRA